MNFYYFCYRDGKVIGSSAGVRPKLSVMFVADFIIHCGTTTKTIEICKTRHDINNLPEHYLTVIEDYKKEGYVLKNNVDPFAAVMSDADNKNETAIIKSMLVTPDKKELYTGMSDSNKEFPQIPKVEMEYVIPEGRLSFNPQRLVYRKI